MTLGDIIRIYRDQHGLSVSEFSAFSDIPRSTLYVLERGKTPRGKLVEPSFQTFQKAADAMNRDVHELRQMCCEPTQTATNLLPFPQTHQVPRLGRIACGSPLLAEGHIEDYDAVPDYIRCDFTLVCQGDSMINARIFDGDLVCIRLQPHVENGEIAAVMVDGNEATLKRVRQFEDHIILEPENPKYSPQVFWNEEMARVTIIGKATHFISSAR